MANELTKDYLDEKIFFLEESFTGLAKDGEEISVGNGTGFSILDITVKVRAGDSIISIPLSSGKIVSMYDDFT